MVELPATVIGHIDHIDTMIDRQGGILRGRNALENQWNGQFGPKPVNVLPGQRGLVFASRHDTPAAIALGDIALAPTVVGAVDGQAKRGAPCSHCPVGDLIDPGRITMHVQLIEPQRLRHGLRDGVQAHLAYGAEHVCNAEPVRGGGRSHCRIGCEELEAADWGKQQRQTQGTAQERCSRLDVADISQHPGLESQRIERRAVSAHGGFCFRAADNVVPVVMTEFLAGFFDDLVQR